ncbi:complement C1q-like protein 4 [Saccostrea cucullata]|uniref:complement C1q-like protein 4 n=1 Tax=Saccostrea cuccullata TaxID=36930 RepID=UPI002ED4B116
MKILQFSFGIPLFGIVHGGRQLHVISQMDIEDVIQELKSLQNIVKYQSQKILDLEETSKEHMDMIKAQRNEIKEVKDQLAISKKRYGMDSSDKKQQKSNHLQKITAKADKVEPNESLIRRGRITPPSSNDHGPVAFYAYMSSDMTNIGGHHPLVFDVVKTNTGNAYHQSTGTFTVPQTGLYVFTWSVRVTSGSYHSVELVVNGKMEGIVYQQSMGKDDDQGGSTIVILANEHDDVFLRTTMNMGANSGSIHSNSNGFTSFAGWKLN